MKNFAWSLSLASMLVATGVSAQEPTLIKKDHQKISQKRLVDKAWKNIDTFLTKVITLGIAFGIGSNLVPTKKYHIPYSPLFYDDTNNKREVAFKEKIVNYVDEAEEQSSEFTIVKPRLIHGIGTFTGAALFAKLLVKIKRAKAHEMNPLQFILYDTIAN